MIPHIGVSYDLHVYSAVRTTKSMTKRMKFTVLSAIVILLLGCGGGATQRTDSGCINASKPMYLLPFPKGETYLLLQGNCGKHSHFGHDAFAFDFRMPVGTYVLAMRTGRVVNVRDEFRDGTNTNDSLNFIIILHDDSTASRYLHITQRGALVKRGMRVTAGDTIAISGNSGVSTEPHLHVDVTGYCTSPPCQTLPFSFINSADPVPIQGKRYKAR